MISSYNQEHRNIVIIEGNPLILGEHLEFSYYYQMELLPPNCRNTALNYILAYKLTSQFSERKEADDL